MHVSRGFGSSRLRLLVVLSGALVAVRCTPTEDVTSQSEAILGSSASATGSPFNAVGWVVTTGGGCSGAIVEADETGGVILLAAHCVAALAQRCASEDQLTANATFAVYVDGIKNDETYAIDRIVTHPRAFLNIAACPQPAPPGGFSCSTGGGIFSAEDLALAHFHKGVGGHPVSFWGITPVPMLTSITDSNSPFNTTWSTHVVMDVANDFVSSSATTQVTLTGFGTADTPNFMRRGGSGAFLTRGPNWDVVAETQHDCTESTANPFNCPADGAPHCKNANSLSVHRIPNGNGTFSGVASGRGDSGSPLLIHAGVALGDFSDLQGASGGPWFIIGALSGGSQKGSGPPPISATFDSTSNYAPTFSAVAGPWLENTVKSLTDDSDGDGINRWADNCPLVANPKQEDTNYVAEFVDEQRRQCADFPGQVCPTIHQVPTAGGAFADAFHQFFPGDACDPVTSTEGAHSGVRFGSGLTGPCDVVTISGNQTSSATSGTCEQQEDTQLAFQSWTGNNAGSAAPVDGEAAPFFCRCDGSTIGDPDGKALDCGDPNAHVVPCVVADDETQPGGTRASSAGWNSMTQRVFPPKAAAYDAALYRVVSSFQERLGNYPDRSVTRNWDFIVDRPLFGAAGATSLDGILWAHVTPNNSNTMPTCPDRTTGSSCLLADLDNHYLGMTGELHHGMVFNVIPGPTVIFHIGGWFDGVNGDPGPGAPFLLPWFSFLQASTGTEILRLAGSQAAFATSSFAPSARTLLAGVAAGTSDLLVGDDVATGIRHATTPLAAVIVAHNTTGVLGALRVGTGAVQGVPVSPVGVPIDPPDLRAFAAYDATLYSVHVASVGATVSALDVQAALGGIASSTTRAIYGVIPVNPMALVWNASNRSLYAVDRIPSGYGRSRLRLLNIDVHSGQSFQLWQTTPNHNLPTAFLSVGANGDLVLGLVGVDVGHRRPSCSEHDHGQSTKETSRSETDDDEDSDGSGKTELVRLGRGGQAIESQDFDGTLVLSPLAVPAGVNVAIAQNSGGSKLPIRGELHPSAAFLPALCGANWLKSHADTTQSAAENVLAPAVVTCCK